MLRSLLARLTGRPSAPGVRRPAPGETLWLDGRARTIESVSDRGRVTFRWRAPGAPTLRLRRGVCLEAALTWRADYDWWTLPGREGPMPSPKAHAATGGA